jgi:peroxidase
MRVASAHPVGQTGHLGGSRSPLPPPTLVSTELAGAVAVTPDPRYTHMLTQWGQFVEHYLDHAGPSLSSARFSGGQLCSSNCTHDPPCFPMTDIHGDPPCVVFARSSPVCGSRTTSSMMNSVHAREQINQPTAYLDASNVYGSSEQESQALRDPSAPGGLLRIGLSWSPSGKFLLPFSAGPPTQCTTREQDSHSPCFLAGDPLANEQLALKAMHTL